MQQQLSTVLTTMMLERQDGQPETNVNGRSAVHTSSCCALALSPEERTGIETESVLPSDAEAETETKADLLNLCFGTFLSRVWLLFRLEGGRGVIQAGHGALHPPLLNQCLQLTDALLVVSHLHKRFAKFDLCLLLYVSKLDLCLLLYVIRLVGWPARMHLWFCMTKNKLCTARETVWPDLLPLLFHIHSWCGCCPVVLHGS